MMSASENSMSTAALGLVCLVPLAAGTLLLTDGMTPSLTARFKYWAPCLMPCSAAVTAAAEERTP